MTEYRVYAYVVKVMLDEYGMEKSRERVLDFGEQQIGQFQTGAAAGSAVMNMRMMRGG